MAICRPPRSISPPSPVHLFHGILILGSGRKAPYVSIRILCALKWRCNSPGIHSVTRDNVVLRVKGSPLKGQLLKQEVCELIAKALEAPKPQVSILENGKKQTTKFRDLTVEYIPNGTCFLGDLPEGDWVSRATKKLAECVAKD
ncbi:hypothetical protein PG995_000366 [Apiospora arundinis]